MAHSGHVMTLANSIIGVGVLAMPYCFQRCGIILAILLLILSNWNTQLCCHYLIKSSLLTRRRSFEFLGFHAFGGTGKLIVELCIIGYLLGTCVTYFVVIGELGPQIVAEILDLESVKSQLRAYVMITVSALCVIPLGLLKNVDSLSAICTVSIGFYMCLILKIVCESKNQIMNNSWASKVVYWEPAGVLQCLPIFSMALSCQMQIFEIFGSINNQSLDKLNGIVRRSTWICTFVYIGVGLFGYIAYCHVQFSGNVLTNLSPSFVSDVIKVGFILSVAFSFPLVIFPCRASIYSLLYRKGSSETSSSHIPETRFRTITIIIVAVSLCFALMIPSIELVIGLVGSTIGVAICIIFPAMSFRKIIKKESSERASAQFILACGLCLMILSTFANLSAIDERKSQLEQQPVKIDEILLQPPPVILHEKDSGLGKSIVEPAKPNKNIVKHEDAPLPIATVDTKISSAVLSKDILPESINKADVIAHDKPKQIQVPAADNAVASEKAIVNTEAAKSIDAAAIIQAEAVNAEELKDSNVVVELQKTNNELRETKDMLERRVGVLEKQLLEHNKDTKLLVEEKFGKVSQRVDEIERRTQPKGTNKPTQKKTKKKELGEQNITKAQNVLQNSNGSQLRNDQALPLPLALRNSMQAKSNDTAARP